jgi:hypothetical protein
MTTTTTAPDVPMPGGAVRVYEWEGSEVTDCPEPSRYFVGDSRVVAPGRRTACRLVKRMSCLWPGRVSMLGSDGPGIWTAR